MDGKGLEELLEIQSCSRRIEEILQRRVMLSANIPERDRRRFEEYYVLNGPLTVDPQED